MLFEFLHKDKRCLAFVNERHPMGEQSLRIYVLDCNQELGYELIFNRGGGRDWSTISLIKYNHPDTYNNLCGKLEEIFPGQTFPARHIPVSQRQMGYKRA